MRVVLRAALAGLLQLVPAGTALAGLPSYSVSAANIAALRLMAVPITLGSFSGVNPDMSCRLSPLAPDSDQSFASYIRDALNSEIVIAGIPQSRKGLTLNGELTKIDIDCGMSQGSWTIEMSFSINNGKPFIVQSTHTFDGSFFGETTHENAEQAFVPAVQDLLAKMLKAVPAEAGTAPSPAMIADIVTPPANDGTLAQTSPPDSTFGTPSPQATPSPAPNPIVPPPAHHPAAGPAPSGTTVAVSVVDNCSTTVLGDDNCDYDNDDNRALLARDISQSLNQRGIAVTDSGSQMKLVVSVTGIGDDSPDTTGLLCGLMCDLAASATASADWQLVDVNGRVIGQGKEDSKADDTEPGLDQLAQKIAAAVASTH